MMTFGADPELMLKDDERYRSAIGIIPGTRHQRTQHSSGAYFCDNVMAEFNIHPALDREHTVYMIQDSLKVLSGLAAKQDCRLVVKAAHKFDQNELQHDLAYDTGCEADVCAYALDEISLPKEKFHKTPLRTAGGHVHLGSKFLKQEITCIHVTRMMDLFIGTAGIFLDKDATSKTRKELYGQAGRYRIPSHGLEYRPLGNFWLGSPNLVRLVYDMCQFVYQFVLNQRHKQFWDVDESYIYDDDKQNKRDFDPAKYHHCHGYNTNNLQASINMMDRNKGRPFLVLIKDFLPSKLYERIIRISEQTETDFYEEWEI